MYINWYYLNLSLSTQSNLNDSIKGDQDSSLLLRKGKLLESQHKRRSPDLTVCLLISLSTHSSLLIPYLDICWGLAASSVSHIYVYFILAVFHKASLCDIITAASELYLYIKEKTTTYTAEEQ